MNYKELERLVEQWAQDKGILDKATPLTQHDKTQEEVDELLLALTNQAQNIDTYINPKGVMCETDYEIKDALGDILVTIIIQAKLQDLNLIECLESAYNVISKRTGNMINGQFVKD